MKTRQGFVSNSSTSSFVVIGFYIDDLKAAREKLNIDPKLEDSELQKYGIIYFYDCIPMAGVFLAYVSSDDGQTEENVNLSEVATKVEEIRVKLGLEGPAKLISGIIAS